MVWNTWTFNDLESQVVALLCHFSPCCTKSNLWWTWKGLHDCLCHLQWHNIYSCILYNFHAYRNANIVNSCHPTWVLFIFKKKTHLRNIHPTMMTMTPQLVLSRWTGCWITPNFFVLGPPSRFCCNWSSSFWSILCARTINSLMNVLNAYKYADNIQQPTLSWNWLMKVPTRSVLISVEHIDRHVLFKLVCPEKWFLTKTVL